MPVQDIGSWSAENCLLDICLLVLSMLKDLSMLKLLVSSMLKDIGGGRVGILPICNSLCWWVVGWSLMKTLTQLDLHIHVVFAILHILSLNLEQ